MIVTVGMDGEGGQRQPREIRFGTRAVRVLAVDDRWYGRDRTWWKVTTEEGSYVLVHDETLGLWDLAAVVAEAPAPLHPRPSADGAPPLH